MRKFSVLFLCSFLILGGAFAVSKTEIQSRGFIKVGIYPELEPFTSSDTSDGYAGFDVDIIKKIAQMWKVDIEWVPIVAWGDNIPGLQSRKFDIFIAPFTITPQRSKLILFTQPHFNAGQVVVKLAKNKSIQSVKDLVGKKVAAMKGTTCVAAARQIPDAIVMAIPVASDVIQTVLDGKADAYIIDRPIALADVKKDSRLEIVGSPFTVEYYGYGINKEDSEFLTELNAAITMIHESGEWEKIFNKWFK